MAKINESNRIEKNKKVEKLIEERKQSDEKKVKIKSMYIVMYIDFYIVLLFSIL